MAFTETQNDIPPPRENPISIQQRDDLNSDLTMGKLNTRSHIIRP